jgi:abequosyltransferase
MRLSICIPTYNRATELRLLLASIAAQTGYSLELEILISDNASTDNTQQIIEEFIATGMNIVYAKSSENRGYDRNILNAVSMASGDYCWLFGSDDLLEEGALAGVEQGLRSHDDLSGLSIGSQGYTPDMSQHMFVNDNISTSFDKETLLIGREQVAAAIGPWLGYMSGLIVRREQWRKVTEDSSTARYMTGYVHLYVALQMLDAKSRWLVIPDRLVGCRTGNESFDAKNEFSRTRLDIVEFELVFGDPLGRDNWAYRRAMTMVAGFFVRSHLLSAKKRGASWAYWSQATPLCFRTFWRYPVFWTKIVPILVIPRPLLLAVRKVHRMLIPSPQGV